jgi:mRNA interferase MazF
VSSSLQTPARGEIYYVHLDPVVGAESKKARPCVIVQRDSANASSPTTIVCPITDARDRAGNLLNVLVRKPEGGTRKDSLVTINQIRAVDQTRISGPSLGRLSGRTMALVDEGLRAILDLGDS